ncbi:THUMP domain-containing class I SAM-dependent RNA methyltransferase [Limnoglobus roseus]|uniref:RNA methyltransferase n=1 Tax=Limnoglobus roseus TaxID=2598579 RepID=A0A5C1AHV1_9BACT|nr:THUMP domain-containing protein [Limnoglobus roseus]QEL17232.1 RNA methyltransferase [Limnoglobus roseus]
MPRYFITCARGLEKLLAGELTHLHAADIEVGRGGVYCAGDHALLYRANLWLRTAVRVLQPVHEADVRNPDQLYDACRAVNWAEYMTPDHTLAVDCNVRDSGITHSQYAARRVKDAICDQFRERTGVRPSVDTETPMVPLNLHVYRDHMVLSLDSSWNSLHKRGYRPILVKAPLNESLACGILLASGWDGSVPLVDWMCGSGTFAIEGAWMATNRAPGMMRKWFGFMGWPSFDRPLWNAIREDARQGVKPLAAPISGGDIRRDAIEFAKTNAKAAGIGNLLKFDLQDLKDARPPAGPPGILVCNPPYGERLGEESELADLYRLMGESFLAHWQGWRMLMLTSNNWLARQTGLKVVKTTDYYNGSLPCLLWEFAAERKVRK